ncbi:hypothetical protein BM477_02955 [Boudabousia marimammalium]|uniref:Uncharacterized protein n=1 Tax=Boudabousia marimammalium TaxID=156892 RepID=A0A1Q5PSH7_9ACTO|nr:hypothetical protein BM477_02955 [Boudabousia marimammalium]
MKSRPGRPAAVCLLDGPSGTGKSTLARALLAALPRTRGPRWAGLQLVQMDDFYPGWEGLAAGQQILAKSVLSSFDTADSGEAAAAETASKAAGYGYWRWDWAADRAGKWRTLPAGAPLLVEGCGALTRETISLADFGIWIEMDEATRKARALGRDGDMFAPHWEGWLSQEQQHWQQNHPAQLADLCFSASLETDL